MTEKKISAWPEEFASATYIIPPLPPLPKKFHEFDNFYVAWELWVL